MLAHQEKKRLKAHPPRIQLFLKRAHNYRQILESRPVGPGKRPTELPKTYARILPLLDLAEPIQKYILALPPSYGQPLIPEKTIRDLCHIAEPKKQIERFNQLLTSSKRINQPP